LHTPAGWQRPAGLQHELRAGTQRVHCAAAAAVLQRMRCTQELPEMHVQELPPAANGEGAVSWVVPCLRRVPPIRSQSLRPRPAQFARFVTDVLTSKVPCGVGNVVGNKGGAAVSCKIAGRSLAAPAAVVVVCTWVAQAAAYSCCPSEPDFKNRHQCKIHSVQIARACGLHGILVGCCARGGKAGLLNAPHTPIHHPHIRLARTVSIHG